MHTIKILNSSMIFAYMIPPSPSNPNYANGYESFLNDADYASLMNYGKIISRMIFAPWNLHSGHIFGDGNLLKDSLSKIDFNMSEPTKMLRVRCVKKMSGKKPNFQAWPFFRAARGKVSLSFEPNFHVSLRWVSLYTYPENVHYGI